MFSFDSLFDFFYEMAYYIDYFFCKVLSILYSFFDVFSGVKMVSYGGEKDYLLNIFFWKTSVGNIYWFIAIIGITLSFAFSIYAVVKKIFDIEDKVKGSLGSILGNQFKCILFILLMNFIMQNVINFSNGLLENIVYIFNNESQLGTPETINFNSKQYATMARVINTIGNYSVNPSYDSRYNINTCYNDIRLDMKELYDEGVFRYAYDDDETDEEEPSSWQYYLTKIANAHDIYTTQPIDQYDANLVQAIKACMDQISINPDFKPIDSYTKVKKPIESTKTPFDALIFLAGTSSAAKNAQYNKNPDFFDNLRYDYIKENGKSIYDLKQVKQDFDISFSKFDHLAIILLGIVLVKVFLSLCINCIARIFNMVLLYLIAPLFIAVTPLDEGEKTKQWSIAFIVQAFGVFGSVFGIRIMMIFVSVIFNAKLVMFEDSTLNFFARLLMVFAVAVTVEQASKIVTGILANNAGFQSIQAGDVGSAGASRIIGRAQQLGGKALSLAGSTVKHSPLGSLYNMATAKFKNSDSKLAKTLGFLTGTGVGGSKSAYEKKYEDARKERQAAKKAEKEAAKKKSEGTGTDSGDDKGGGDGGDAPGSGSNSSETPKNNTTLNENKGTTRSTEQGNSSFKNMVSGSNKNRSYSAGVRRPAKSSMANVGSLNQGNNKNNNKNNNNSNSNSNEGKGNAIDSNSKGSATGSEGGNNGYKNMIANTNKNRAFSAGVRSSAGSSSGTGSGAATSARRSTDPKSNPGGANKGTGSSNVSAGKGSIGGSKGSVSGSEGGNNGYKNMIANTNKSRAYSSGSRKPAGSSSGSSSTGSVTSARRYTDPNNNPGGASKGTDSQGTSTSVNQTKQSNVVNATATNSISTISSSGNISKDDAAASPSPKDNKGNEGYKNMVANTNRNRAYTTGKLPARVKSKLPTTITSNRNLGNKGKE